ncbi:EAL domain-containing protein [Actinoplanes sp. TFC3]|uniref:sensor domain-containing phosphodiesterase n=1 Tax=Actinoplanes sp. TFC3 TaxID=1710355 RepID=UPI0008312E4E|nr:EAL domain-containing protein [Actinoplanes sp. TFC3]
MHTAPSSTGLATAAWQPDEADLREVDRLLTLARQHLGVEVTWVSAFTAGQQVFHAATGELDAMNVSVGDGSDLHGAICTRVLAGTLPNIITDTRRHPVTRDLPVTQQLRIGSYAGVPWHGPDGMVAGMLCCVSRHPDPTLNARTVNYLALIADLISNHMSSPVSRQRQSAAAARRTVQRVLDTDAIRMVFQPVVELDSRRVIGFEALARFDPRTFTGPDKAFAAATQSGLGTALELAAVRHALRRLPDLPDRSWLAVNLSAEALLDPQVRDTLLAHAGDQVTVEITEHTQVDNYGLLSDALDPLRQAGIRLSVDDAGAGYASLHHILQLQPDLIKLDISLVRDIDTDPVKTALAESLNGFAARIGASLIAEGIETAAEHTRLSELGVTYGQGYHLARPADLP